MPGSLRVQLLIDALRINLELDLCHESIVMAVEDWLFLDPSNSYALDLSQSHSSSVIRLNV